MEVTRNWRGFLISSACLFLVSGCSTDLHRQSVWRAFSDFCLEEFAGFVVGCVLCEQQTFAFNGDCSKT